MTQLFGSGQADAQAFGDGRPGLTFAEIRAQTADGADGPGLAFNDWDGPADDPREVVVQLVQPPATGTLKLYRNGAVALAGAADGVWPFTYRLRVDGVATRPVTSYFVVGAAALAVGDLGLAAAAVNGGATSTVGKQRYGLAAFAAKQLYGTAKTQGATAAGALALASAVVSGRATVSAVASGALALAPAVAAGSASPAGASPVASGTLTLAPATASGSALGATAPAGSGIYPDPATVLAGVRYGPTGVEFTGTLQLCAPASAIADAVRAELAVELLRLNRLAKIHGLVEGVPLRVTADQRTAGDVVQSVTDAAGVVSVELMP